MSNDHEIKVGMLTKRSQKKKSFGPVNLKQRIFVLTSEKISYYEGTLGSRGRLKGSIFIEHITFVGPLDDRALNRQFSFQIVHQDCYLYCFADNQNDKDDWIFSISNLCPQRLETFYHSQPMCGKTWSCCQKVGAKAIGCKVLSNDYKPISTNPCTPQREFSQMQESLAHYSNLPLTGNPPPTPPRNPRYVVALYNFDPIERSDISLTKGEYYSLIDNSKENWWLIQDERGVTGMAPANYVRLL